MVGAWSVRASKRALVVDGSVAFCVSCNGGDCWVKTLQKYTPQVYRVPRTYDIPVNNWIFYTFVVLYVVARPHFITHGGMGRAGEGE